MKSNICTAEEIVSGDFEDIISRLENMKEEEGGRPIMEHLVDVVLADNGITRKRIKLVARTFIAAFPHLFASLCETIVQRIEAEKSIVEEDNAKWSLLTLVAAFPSRAGKKSEKMRGKASVTDSGESLQNVWLEIFSKIPLSSKMLRFVLPHFTENVMDWLPSSELFADFLFNTFRLGNYMAVLSLAGLFKLIINRDFEYPNFYPDVYKLIQPNVCYSNYAQKFFDLVDLIMTSTHVPVYIVSAFVKRLARTLLFAPLQSQSPLIQLIKNILSRHPSVHSLLINRDEPNTLETDPYDEAEANIQKCGAIDSSLWEIKAIQFHWHSKIATKANFVNAQTQDEENSLGWKTANGQFEEMLKKAQAKLDKVGRVAKMDEYSGVYGEEYEGGGRGEDGESGGDDDGDGEQQQFFDDGTEEPALKRRKPAKEALINEELNEMDWPSKWIC